MAAAHGRPELDGDSLGAARFHTECMGFGAGHVLVEIDGGVGLEIFGPVAAGASAPARYHVLRAGVECAFAVVFGMRASRVPFPATSLCLRRCGQFPAPC